MFNAPVASKHLRFRLHWGDSVEEIEQEVNSNLDAYPDLLVYGMSYQVVAVPGVDKKVKEKHFVGVFFKP